MFFDADTHIDECDDTWSYMPKASKDLAPTTIALEYDQIPPWFDLVGYHRFWFMDGQLHPRRIRSDERTGTTVATRELNDVRARLKDMDTLDIDTQVIYPTVFLSEVTRRSDLDIALCLSYNRWLADRCAESMGRLHWVAVLPFSSISDALSEMKWAKNHGACGIFKRGVEWNMSAGHPHFEAIYAAASDLDLPICIHSSLPWGPVEPQIARFGEPYGLGQLGLTVIQAFQSLVASKIPQRFPNLRIGFIEAGSSWIPYMLDTVARTGRTENRRFLQDSRFHVTCEVHEDLPYLFKTEGDEQFFIGTDYAHADQASVMNAHTIIMNRTDIDKASMRRITGENARVFYGLD